MQSVGSWHHWRCEGLRTGANRVEALDQQRVPRAGLPLVVRRARFTSQQHVHAYRNRCVA